MDEQATSKQDLVVRRIIDAPVELVWQAWTVAEHVMRWWGPEHYTSPSATIDLRVGGRFVFCMRAPQSQGGQDSYTSGTYTNIVPMEVLEFTHFLSDADGNPIDPTSIGMPPDFPSEQLHTVTFRPRKEMTELTIVEHDWPMSHMYVFSLAGMHQCIDKLAAQVEEAEVSVS